MNEIEILQKMIADSRWKYSKDHVIRGKISKEMENEWKNKKASSWVYSEEREAALKKVLDFYIQNNK